MIDISLDPETIQLLGWFVLVSGITVAGIVSFAYIMVHRHKATPK